MKKEYVFGFVILVMILGLFYFFSSSEMVTETENAVEPTTEAVAVVPSSNTEAEKQQTVAQKESLVNQEKSEVSDVHEPLYGRVVTEKQEPVINGEVILSQQGVVLDRVYTDVEGKFRLNQVQVDDATDLVLIANAPGFQAREKNLFRLWGRNDEHLLILLPGIQISGTLKSETGEPLEEAYVSRTWGRHKVFCDEHGRFSIIVKPQYNSYFNFKAKDHQMREYVLEEAYQDMDLGTVILQKGYTMHGRVVNQQDLGLKNALIFLTPSKDATAITDAHGYFTLDGLNKTQIFSLEVAHPKYMNKKLGPLTFDETYEIYVQLEPYAELKARFLDESGVPIQGVEVILSQSRDVSRSRTKVLLQETDKNGSVHFKNVPVTTLALNTLHPNYVKHMVHNVAVVLNELTDLGDIVLKHGVTLSGRVLDRNEESLMNVLVEIVGHSASMTMTNNDGSFSFDGVPYGPVNLRAVYGQNVIEKQIEIVPADNQVVLYFEGYELHGFVFDEKGEPIAAANFSLTGKEISGKRDTMSRGDGSFTIDNLESGDYDLAIRKNEYYSYKTKITIQNDDLVLEPIHMKRGNIRLSGAIFGLPKAIKSKQVRAKEQETEETKLGEIINQTYQINELTPGYWLIDANIEDPEETIYRASEVVIIEDKDEYHKDLTLVMGSSLKGHVLKNLHPLAKYIVRLYGQDNATKSLRYTDEDGFYEFDGLTEGQYQMKVQQNFGKKYLFDESIYISGSHKRDIHLDEFVVRGQVVDQSNQPVSGAKVDLKVQSRVDNYGLDISFSALTDKSGHFAVAEVVRGEWVFEVSQVGYARYSELVSIYEDQEIQVQLKDEQIFSFKASNEKGVSSTRLSVLLTDAEGKTVMNTAAYPDDELIFHVREVPEGHWQCFFRDYHGQVAVGMVGETIPHYSLAKEATLTIEIPAFLNNSRVGLVRLVHESGYVYPEAFRSNLINGRVEYQHLSPGLWQAMVTASDGAQWQGQIEVRPGEKHQLLME